VVMGVLATIVAVGAMLAFAPLRDEESREWVAAGGASGAPSSLGRRL